MFLYATIALIISNNVGGLWLSVFSITSPSADFGRLRTPSEDVGLLRESSEMIVSSSKIPALPGQKSHAYISEKVGKYNKVLKSA